MLKTYACTVCGKWSPERHCPEHRPKPRPSFRKRGYGRDFERNRRKLLAAHPVCALCPAPAVVADHHPLTRRQRVARGLDPDALDGLRALCRRCHSRETALDPRTRGGWNRR